MWLLPSRWPNPVSNPQVRALYAQSLDMTGGQKAISMHWLFAT